MQNLEEFYILGEPIETDLGDCSFLTVKDYPSYSPHLEVLGLSKEKIVFLRHQQGERIEVINELQKLELVELVLLHTDIRGYYEELFARVFKDEDALYKIKSHDEFNAHRNLIMRMNCIREEKINPNPEIQKWIEKSKRFKQQEGDKITNGDMIASIAMFSGVTYKEIAEMTIYQMYMSFNSIGNFKNYDTTTLYSTVSSEKIKIHSWSEHIDLFKEEKHGISRSEFDEKSSGLFGSR